MFNLFKNNKLVVNLEAPGKPDVIALLEEHMKDMYGTSPEESVHALDISGLQKPDIMFLTARKNKQLLGCGALRGMGAGTGEIKSMRTVTEARHQGVATAIMEFILDVSVSRGYHTLYLETGTADYFLPARKMYEKFGFVECAPFGSYVEDPHSYFMRLDVKTLVPNSF